MGKELKASIMLFITSIIWGLAFVAQAQGMEHIGPFTFTAARSLVAIIFLHLTYVFFNKTSKSYREQKFDMKRTIRGGVLCGLVFTFGINFQQIGLVYTTAGKASFLTALYIVFIPIIGLFYGKKINKKLQLCIVLAMIGTYLMSVKGSLSMNIGDLITIFGSIVFAIHILMLSEFSKDTNAVLVSLIQFAVCGFFSLIAALIFEGIDMSAILKSYLAILYVGILSSGVGFTIQLMALKELDPVVASMISSLESVFGAVFGWLILSQSMSEREIIGGIIIFLATLIAQLPIEVYLQKKLEGR
ncbi:MAG: DMT family transporter [Peptoniphilus grossensis]|uniref:DMT family transporter n=1 Tax=Peptoniphilus grossensis TaxID=1465756 RepID=UPI002907F554|nr:DMT family transporter [Peptoniphilus grossensis]MDU7151622.1 DMT family transporter [Peptoniphilus grossensis]